ncbi:sensor histidine kinase [Planotetraspora sp. GP83]|uniref:sensor histidine kinase n=1 Tax=Planotetraspora sp. GP83 TaxID=3156264 RepID=UPI0035149DE6
MGEMRARFAERPVIVDALLACAVLAYAIPPALTGRPFSGLLSWWPVPPWVAVWGAVLSAVAAALSMLVRRRTAWPSIVASLLCLALTGQGVAVTVAAYSMTAEDTARRWRLTAAVMTAVYIVLDHLNPGPDRLLVLSAVRAVTLVYLPALIGTWVRGCRTTLAGVWQREEQAASRERRRIAGEMHDTVTHAVTVMVLNAGLIQDTQDLGEIRRLARSIEDKGVRALTELREVLTVLRRRDMPPSAEGLEAIPQLVAEGNATGLKCGLHLDVPEGTVAREAAHACYRVVQEGLNNVRKHAPASEVRITCEARDDVVTVAVVNSAEGRLRPYPAAPRIGSGYGLVGLKERVNLIGGWLTSGPTPEGGFALTARIPCHPPDGER